MRRSICELTKPSARRELRLAGISTSTTADVHIRVLTAAPRIKPTSTRCHSAWQPKPGRGSTYRRGDFVQTSGTSSGYRCQTGVTGINSVKRAQHIHNPTIVTSEGYCDVVYFSTDYVLDLSLG